MAGGADASSRTEAITLNTYSCDKCSWQYVWTMGDRVREVKRHELAHLIDQPEEPRRPGRGKNEVRANLLIDYIHERLRNVEFV